MCGEDDLLYNDYEAVKQILSCSIRDIHKYDTPKNEYQTMHQHLDRHLNEIVFTKYENRTCCEEWRSKEILQHFDNSLLSVKFPAPTQSKECMGHYKTSLQECISETKRYGHEGQPTAVADNLGSCQLRCRAYHFKSKTAKARHISVFHRRQTKVAPGLTSYKCDVANCGGVFKSLSSLNRHKIKDGHTTRKNRKEPIGKKRTSKQPGSSSKRQRTLQDMLRNSMEEDQACAALECTITSYSSMEIDWIQCDRCDRWLHAICVGVKDPSEIDQYVCYSCE